MELANDVPVISSIEPSEAKKGGTITIRGYYFARPGADLVSTTTPAVKIGGVSIPRVQWLSDGTGVTARVAAATKAGRLTVVVRAQGGTTDSNVDHVTVKA
jgi:hypothetical protein